jgi:hypothetical protein
MYRRNWLPQIRRRIVLGTPAALRPLLFVGVLGIVMVVAQAGAVLVYRLGGESRSLNFKFIAFVSACAGMAALVYGLCRAILPPAMWARPWILGLAASASFWLSEAILAPSAIQSFTDVIALCVAILAFGGFGGYLQWRSDRDTKRKDA